MRLKEAETAQADLGRSTVAIFMSRVPTISLS
jgi:hypothetical protein